MSLFQLSPIKAIELAASRIPGSISLAQGIPSFRTPVEIRNYVQEKMMQGAVDKYSLTTGLAELREEISLALQQEGLSYDPETEIVATAGSIEGITASILACTEPGDEVILPSPTYTSYQGSLGIARAKPVFVPLDEDNNFDFSVEAIERAITRKTKAILYASPNNPTGTLFSEAKTRKLVDLALEHNLTLVLDEVYKDFYYTSDPHFSPVSIPEARKHIIRVCSFSKAYAMTGWRIGFLHADKSWVTKLLKYHDAMVTCAPVISQYAGIAALRYCDAYRAEFRAEFKRRRDYTIQALDGLSHVLDYQIPKAAYFVFPRIKNSIPFSTDSTRLAYDILEKVKVATVPGVAFGPSGESHLRISFGREMQDITEGLARMSDYFHTSRPQQPRMDVRVQPPSTSEPLKSGAIKILQITAKLYLKRTRPLVIGIAGLRGKTVFKRLLMEALSPHFRVRANQLSFNTAVGLPLSVLELVAPTTRTQKFLFPLQLFQKALFAQEASELVILEYGVRSEGDAAALLSIASPDWLILTDSTGEDPSIDYRAVRRGVMRLTQNMATEKILWSSDDAALLESCAHFSADNSFSSRALVDGKLTVSEGKDFSVTRELVGKSALAGAHAAAKLALKLGVEPQQIAAFLSPPDHSSVSKHR